jgi:hypothetical protein
MRLKYLNSDNNREQKKYNRGCQPKQSIVLLFVKESFCHSKLQPASRALYRLRINIRLPIPLLIENILLKLRFKD